MGTLTYGMRGCDRDIDALQCTGNILIVVGLAFDLAAQTAGAILALRHGGNRFADHFVEELGARILVVVEHDRRARRALFVERLEETTGKRAASPSRASTLYQSAGKRHAAR